MKKILVSILFLASFIFLPDSQLQAMDGWRDNGRPYGWYCPGPMGGWYGAKKAVRNADEAKKLLRTYFQNEDVVIGKVKERQWYYEAEIKDKNNDLLDIVIVDKRTGRIRSIY